MDNPEVPASREIVNVGSLDLTGMRSAQALEGITRIANVGTIIVPEPLLERLSAIPMVNVGSTIPVPEGAGVSVFTGQTVLSGEALANASGQPNDVLIVTGQLAITTPVEKIGYGQIIVTGQVLAPSGSETALGAGLTRMTGQVGYFPYEEGAAVKVIASSSRMSGEVLANSSGSRSDVLVVLGSLVVTSPVAELGYGNIAVAGILLVPSESEPVLAGRIWSVGNVVYYAGTPRIFQGKDQFSRAFFELLDEPITLVLIGSFAIDDDVTVEVTKAKVAEIVLTGKLQAPRGLVPLLQVLATVRNGRITATDS